MSRLVGSEADLYEQLARYLSLKHPELIGLWHFDLAGVNNPSNRTRALYGRLNCRAWPDLFIAKSVFMPGTVTQYHGLFIELKREGVRLKKQNGDWANDHTAEQADVLARVALEGYVAQFACGYDDAVALIESYLGEKS